MELCLRLGIFLGVFTLLALLEWMQPRRHLRVGKKQRWSRNLALASINALMLFFAPITVVGAAIFADGHQWGIFHTLVLPSYVVLILSILFLDFSVYCQHIAFHKIPFLWRLHKVHHIDQDIDVTTGIRFHPGEILISIFVKILAVIVLGIPYHVVLIFEILLNVTAIFNHSNIRLPLALDKYLRFFLVTPDMHRVHHSTIVRETNSNFGFNLPCWDRLFRTYTEQPTQGHQDMTIGLDDYQNTENTGLYATLMIPFHRDPQP